MTDSVEDIPRLRRSLHFVPGGNERMFAKSLGLPADGLILDLEDSVTADNKSTARDAVVHWLQDADFNGKERLVPISGNPVQNRIVVSCGSSIGPITSEMSSCVIACVKA